MAMQDVPYFEPPKFDPEKGDKFRCYVFKVKEYCALYKLNVGMPRRHVLIQGLPDDAIEYLLDSCGSENCFDQDRANFKTFDEIVSLLQDYYLMIYEPKRKLSSPDSNVETLLSDLKM
uniref:Uncharacterized protein n=1 Tax=Panagrolaimus sp. JU765 TaxID=591449 RepID=A0AC34RLI6_9BILA